MQGTGKIIRRHEEKRPFEDLGVDGANIKTNQKNVETALIEFI
jgi:hypothetical protein